MSFATGQWLLDKAGRLADSDFVDVWAAGKLALDGHAAAAWDWAIHRDAEVAALGHDFPGNYGWHYPPTYLFVAAALATLPYLVALLGWLAVTLPLYVAAVRAIMGERLGILIACAFPAVMWNMLVGQNGFLTAALIGFMLLTLDTRPIVAGVLLGLAHLQAAIRHPVSDCAGGERAVARHRGGERDRCGSGRGVRRGVRHCRLVRLLHLAAGDERDHPRRRPRRAQQAAEPVRRPALARRQHDGSLHRAGAPDRGLRGRRW